jgi:Zn-dependent protease with chaperone function
MQEKITINGLYRDELNSKLYDLIIDIKEKYGDKKNLVILIEDSKYDLPNGYGADFFSYNELRITRGVFKTFNIETEADEIKSLIAHEFSHISNKDATLNFLILGYLMVCACFVLGSISIIFNNIPPIISIVLIIFVFFILGRSYTWNRRGIEVRCDSDAVNITKNFDAQIRYRNKMEARYNEVKNAITFFQNPRSFVKRFVVSIIGRTHPSNEIRINNLENLKEEYKKFR